MKQFVLDFINKFEGYKTAIKNLHWNSKNLSQHKLCDDIAQEISGFQDIVSEVEQSINGNLAFNKLKPTKYRITSCKTFMDDVLKTTTAFYKKLQHKGDSYIGLRSECEAFITKIQRLSYLLNFTLKEDFKRQYERKLNESRYSNSFEIEKGKLNEYLNESINKVLSQYLNESVNDETQNYTHFAYNTYTGLIVDGGDYTDLELDMASIRNDLAESLEGNGFNPKAYHIATRKGLMKKGINPDEDDSWSSTGVWPLSQENEMRENGIDILEKAREKHSNWFC